MGRGRLDKGQDAEMHQVGSGRTTIDQVHIAGKARGVGVAYESDMGSERSA